MDEDEKKGEFHAPKKKKSKKRCRGDDGSDASDSDTVTVVEEPIRQDKYRQYNKPNYIRTFSENSLTEYLVFVENTKGDKLGNRNPITLSMLFKSHVKGIKCVKRINANKIGVTFAHANTANDFLRNDQFLSQADLKAYIPARAVEKIGVIRYVPISISNEELYNKLSSIHEIVSVRRFCRKVNGEIKPYESVSLTFITNNLPEFVYCDLWAYRVHEYVSPLLQCFKCFKFNHNAKYCRSTQKCSICSEEHHFSTCTNPNITKCLNCGGQHLAISKLCPVKIQKTLEKRNKTSYSNIMRSTPNNITFNNYNNDFPTLKKKQSTPTIKSDKTLTPNTSNITTSKTDNEKEIMLSTDKLFEQIVKNESVLKGLVGVLVTLGNRSDNKPLTYSVIKDILINKLKI